MTTGGGGAAVAGIGAVVTVTVVARWGEAGLAPWLPACCLVNGVNVSGTFTDVGGGNYSLSYTVRYGDGDVVGVAPNVTVALVDGAAGVAGDAVGFSRVVGDYTNFTIDSTPPLVDFTCVGWNGTVRPSNVDTVCVACGLRTNEARHGCTVFWRIVGVGVVASVQSTTLTTGVVNVTSSDGDHRVVQFWAVDAAGNVGPVSTLVWTVDSATPVTVWPQTLPNLTNENHLELSLGCTKQGCTFGYNLDNGGMIQSSHGNASGSGGATSTATVRSDTAVALLTPRLTATPTIVVNVTVLTQTVATGATVNSSVPSSSSSGNGTRAQVRVDGAAAWVDVATLPDVADSDGGGASAQLSYHASTGTVTLSGVVDGTHTIEVRAVDAVVGADTTPWTVVATVNRSPSLVTIVHKPAALSTTPADHALFVLSSSSELVTSYVGAVYREAVSGNGSSGGGDSEWQTVARVVSASAAVAVSGLSPGATYRFDVYAVDSMNNSGPAVSWTWATVPCAAGADAVALADVASYRVDFGQRAFRWVGVREPALTLGVDYAVDDGNWTTLPLYSDAVSMGFLLLSGIDQVGKRVETMYVCFVVCARLSNTQTL